MDKTIREIEPRGERTNGLWRAARDEGAERRKRGEDGWKERREGSAEETRKGNKRRRGEERRRSFLIGSPLIIPCLIPGDC